MFIYASILTENPQEQILKDEIKVKNQDTR